MALAPNRSRSIFRESIRTSTPVLLPSTDVSQNGYHDSGIDGALFDELAVEFAAANAKQDALDKQERARETLEYKVWAEMMSKRSGITLNASYTDPEIDKARMGWEDEFNSQNSEGTEAFVEPRARAKGRLPNREYWSGRFDYVPRGDVPPKLATKAELMQYHSTTAKQVYQHLSRLIKSPNALEVRRFSSILNSLEDYLGDIENHHPAVFKDRKLIRKLAEDILSSDGKMAKYSQTVRDRFSTVTRHIERHMPGLIHAYNVLEREDPSAEHYTNGHKPDAASALRHSEPFVYHPNMNGHNGHSVATVPINVHEQPPRLLSEQAHFIGETYLVPGAPPVPTVFSLKRSRNR